VVEVAATATTAANPDIFRAIAPRPDPAVAAAAATPSSATNVVVMVISPAIAPTKWHRQLLHSLLMAALERFFFFHQHVLQKSVSAIRNSPKSRVSQFLYSVIALCLFSFVFSLNSFTYCFTQPWILLAFPREKTPIRTSQCYFHRYYYEDLVVCLR